MKTTIYILILSVFLLTNLNVFSMEQEDGESNDNESSLLESNIYWQRDIMWFGYDNPLTVFAQKNIQQMREICENRERNIKVVVHFNIKSDANKKPIRRYRVGKTDNGPKIISIPTYELALADYYFDRSTQELTNSTPIIEDLD